MVGVRVGHGQHVVPDGARAVHRQKVWGLGVSIMVRVGVRGGIRVRVRGLWLALGSRLGWD